MKVQTAGAARSLRATAEGSFPRRSTQAPMRVLAWACLAVPGLVLADPALAPSPRCDAANSQEAKSLADVLYEKGEYQHAGECYQAAGDASRAQLAFLKAVGPNSEANARAFKQQQDAAKSLLAKVQQSFRGNH